MFRRLGTYKVLRKVSAAREKASLVLNKGTVKEIITASGPPGEPATLDPALLTTIQSITDTPSLSLIYNNARV